MSKRTIILIVLGALLIAAAFVSLIIELKPKTEDIPEEVTEVIPDKVTKDLVEEEKLLKVVKDNNVKVTTLNDDTGSDKET
jgi:hypothetical protein